MRGRLAVTSVATLFAAVLLILFAESWDACSGRTCTPPPSYVRTASLAGLVLLVSSALALFGALFPLRPDVRPRSALAAALAFTLALVALATLGAHSSSCYASSEGPMRCDETYPRGYAVALGSAAIWLGAFVVSGLAHLVLAAPPGRSRTLGLRLALAALALVLLVPSLSMIGGWTNAPPDAVWGREGGQLCVRWTYGNGGGESCRTLGSVVALPLVIAAGGGAALQAGRPSWRWAGWGAVALAGAGALAVAAANLASPVKSDWWGLAAVAAGLALAVKLLQSDRAAART